ncbi:MAG: iron chelate uptake ABC transporter family permease subunit [Nakamurella sp.]
MSIPLLRARMFPARSFRPRSGPLLVAALLLLLAAAVLAALSSGRGFPVDRLFAAVTDPDSTDGRILRLARAPRVVTAAVAGAALAVAGVILQTVLSNPLASPELTGVNGTAVLGVVVALAAGWVDTEAPVGPLLAALIGGLLGGAITWLLGVGHGRRNADRLLLVGVLVAALSGGVTMLLLAVRADAFATVNRWLVGSVDARTWQHLMFAAPWILGWIAVAVLLSGWLGLLAAGEHQAAAVGVRVPLAGALLMITAVCLIAGATALAGAVAFIGLAVPHLARRLTGTLWRPAALPAAALLGAALLVGCDAVAQTISGFLAGSEASRRLGIPAGAVAAVLGAAALVIIARKDSPAP